MEPFRSLRTLSISVVASSLRHFPCMYRQQVDARTRTWRRRKINCVVPWLYRIFPFIPISRHVLLPLLSRIFGLILNSHPPQEMPEALFTNVGQVSCINLRLKGKWCKVSNHRISQSSHLSENTTPCLPKKRLKNYPSLAASPLSAAISHFRAKRSESLSRASKDCRGIRGVCV